MHTTKSNERFEQLVVDVSRIVLANDLCLPSMSAAIAGGWTVPEYLKLVSDALDAKQLSIEGGVYAIKRLRISELFMDHGHTA